MPNMDGLEVARRLEVSNLQHVPSIFIVTAYGREELFVKAKTLGVADVLIKPISPSVLFDSLARALGDVTALLTEVSEYGQNPADTFLPEQRQLIRGARVLLVEDNEINQEVAVELLKDGGLVVDVAANGAIALEKVQTQPYALVLMDMQMPEMDGIEATIAIRQDPRHQTLPIVAMTANVMQGDRERCLEAGMNDHLGKPIEPKELWHKLCQWIPPQSLAPSPATVNQEQPDDRDKPAVPTETLTIPKDIAGLNTEEGLRRVLGKESFYLKMLHKFVASQQTFRSEITQALEEDNYALAERLAHTLKGVAGNIGAQTVQKEAALLEKSLKERLPQETLQPQLIIVTDCLQVLIEALQAQLQPELPQVSTPVERGPEDWQKLATVCDQLAQLLAEDDAEAADLLQNHHALLSQAFPDHYGAIAENISSFDFEAAQTALTAARQTLPLLDPNP
jgi:two-component system sensor histidine kinase/response regulator